MNQITYCFSILDKICIQPQGKYVLNIKGMKAYQFLIKAKDDHKSWKKFEIFLHGTMLEFIRVYFEGNWAKPTRLRFLDKQGNITWQLLKLFCQILLSPGLAIYEKGIVDRNNDNALNEAGR